MRKMTVYVCSVCEAPHKREADALECEESHTLAEVIEKQYAFGECDSYPARLEISMSDGRIAVYELSHFK